VVSTTAIVAAPPPAALDPSSLRRELEEIRRLLGPLNGNGNA